MDASPRHSPPPTPPGPATLLAWLTIQLIALLLSATKTPLWARLDEPWESTALWLMLSVQCAAAAMLFPWILRAPRLVISAILSSLVFLELAGLLANADGSGIASAAGIVTLWLTGLAAWQGVLFTRQARLIGVSVAAMASVGSLLAIYLAIEFSNLSVLDLWPVIWAILIANFGSGWVALGAVHLLRAKLSTV